MYTSYLKCVMISVEFVNKRFQVLRMVSRTEVYLVPYSEAKRIV